MFVVLSESITPQPWSVAYKFWALVVIVVCLTAVWITWLITRQDKD